MSCVKFFLDAGRRHQLIDYLNRFNGL